MHSRCLRGLLFAVTASAAGLGLTTPAVAAVHYDPRTMAGRVDAGDLRKAFGWTDQVLAARAAGITFRHDFWTDDNYSVTCGGKAFPVVHHADYGNFQLTDDVERASGGYRDVTGFRITGAHSGISGTTVPPTAGQPCPEPNRGATITRARLVSSTSGWDLTASSGAGSRQLLSGQSVGAKA